MQDPVIFSGSVRLNLDPFDHIKNDDEIWQALEQAGLKDTINDLPVSFHSCHFSYCLVALYLTVRQFLLDSWSTVHLRSKHEQASMTLKIVQLACLWRALNSSMLESKAEFAKQLNRTHRVHTCYGMLHALSHSIVGRHPSRHRSCFTFQDPSRSSCREACSLASMKAAPTSALVRGSCFAWQGLSSSRPRSWFLMR